MPENAAVMKQALKYTDRIWYRINVDTLKQQIFSRWHGKRQPKESCTGMVNGKSVSFENGITIRMLLLSVREVTVLRRS